MAESNEKPVDSRGVQGWIERNRAKIWIWGIAGLTLGSVACMFIVVLILILGRR